MATWEFEKMLSVKKKQYVYLIKNVGLDSKLI